MCLGSNRYSAAGNKDVFTQTKTRASKRVVNVPEQTMMLLQEAKKQSNSIWVCPALDGKLPVSPRNFSRLYRGWCHEVGIQKSNVHCLRHTYASLMLKEGVHIKLVQMQLGHSDIKTTLNTYSHLMEGLQEAAAITMDAKLCNLL